MTHETYTRLVPGADSAVLFIHGILGTPNHFADFVSLVPERMSIVNLLLDGHGAGVREFSRTSMKTWEAQVEATVDSLLATHKRLYIAAHSLGTLLAIGTAVKKPVSGLFLLAVPIRLGLKGRVFATCFKVWRGRVRDTDVYTVAARNCCGIEQHKNLILYLGWIPRFWELLVKIRKTQKLMHSLTTPGMAYQSAKDELVSSDSIPCLRSSTLQVTCLENSTHYYYDPQDLMLLQRSFSDLLS
jgi:esterase/lipase